MESFLENESKIIRCHRAYIVNLNLVKHADGNAQGYKLSLPETDFQVPVSRAYIQKVLELFEKPRN